MLQRCFIPILHNLDCLIIRQILPPEGAMTIRNIFTPFEIFAYDFPKRLKIIVVYSLMVGGWIVKMQIMLQKS